MKTRKTNKKTRRRVFRKVANIELKKLIIFLLGIVLVGFVIFSIKQRQDYEFQSSDYNPTPPPLQKEVAYAPRPTGAPTPTIKKVELVKLSDAWVHGVAPFTASGLNITFDYPTYFETRISPTEDISREYSSFNAVFYTPEVYDTYDSNYRCDNTMTIYLTQFENNKNISLYDFIANLNKTYPGDGIMENFDTYKKNLTQTDNPRNGSYVFKGIIGENPEKEVYFEHNGKIYKFGLLGGCNTGEKYSQDAEDLFDRIIQSVK